MTARSGAWNTLALNRAPGLHKPYADPRKQLRPLPICADGLAADLNDGLVGSNIRSAGPDDTGYSLLSCNPCLQITWPTLFDARTVGISHFAFSLQHWGALQTIIGSGARFCKRLVGDRVHIYVVISTIRRLLPRSQDLQRRIAADYPAFASQMTFCPVHLAIIQPKDRTPGWIGRLEHYARARSCEVGELSSPRDGNNFQIIANDLKTLQWVLNSLAEGKGILRMQSFVFETRTVDINLAMTAITPPKTMECIVCARTSQETQIVHMEGCKHTSCVDCFKTWCTTDLKSKLPLRCFGNRCKRHIPILTLTQLFETDELRGLARQALEVATSQDSGENGRWAHCTQPDCGRPYLRNKSVDGEGRQHICTGCLTTTCTECGGPYHFGKTCAANRTHVSPDADMAAWMESADARACTKCQTAMEKVSGCNHVECPGCHIHICWVCMKDFRVGSECYGHMQERHHSYV